MNRQPAIAALQNKLARLEILRGDQLNGLLKQLESYKSKLPIEDHPIIDWGISMVKAKMQEEKGFMHDIDKAWQKLKHKYMGYKKLMPPELEGIDLTQEADQERLYKWGWDHLYHIVRLSCEEGLIRDDFTDAVEQVIEILCDLCSSQAMDSLIRVYIDGYIETCGYNTEEEFKPYYQRLQDDLEEILRRENYP